MLARISLSLILSLFTLSGCLHGFDPFGYDAYGYQPVAVAERYIDVYITLGHTTVSDLEAKLGEPSSIFGMDYQTAFTWNQKYENQYFRVHLTDRRGRVRVSNYLQVVVFANHNEVITNIDLN